MNQNIRKGYCSHRRPGKAQMSLRISAVSPEPLALADIGSMGKLATVVWNVPEGCNWSESINEPAREKGTLCFSGLCFFSNTHAQSVFGLQTDFFCLKLPKCLCYMSANRKSSGETALMRSLTWTLVDRLCDKYPSFMCCTPNGDSDQPDRPRILRRISTISLKSIGVWLPKEVNGSDLRRSAPLHGGHMIL